MYDDGVEIAPPNRPVAWSRHNLVAVAASDAVGACVLVAPVRGKAVAAPCERLRPKGTFDVPTHVSFSPCGHTICAYFPVAQPVLVSRPLSRLPSAQDASGTPGASALPSLEQLAGAGATPSSTVMSFSTPQLGQLCVWSYVGASWTLQQCVAAHASETEGAIYGDVADICWLGAWRPWTRDESFKRGQMQGPPMFSRVASMPLEEAQQEQAFIVVSKLCFVALFHHLPDATDGFRMLHGWVHKPSVYPPPATLEAFDEVRAEHSGDAVAEDGMSHLAHVSCCPVPGQSAVLISYVVSDEPRSIPDAHESRAVCMTELRIELEGEMSFLTVRPMDTVATADGRISVLAWSPSLTQARQLRMFVATLDGEGTRISAFDVSPKAAGSADYASTQKSAESLDDWTAVRSTSLQLNGRVSALLTPPHSTPDGHTVWAAMPGAWSGFDVDTCKSTHNGPLGIHGPFAISPNGVLVCARSAPSGKVALAPLPVASSPLEERAGYLMALSMLRQCSASDVSCWMRLHTDDIGPVLPKAVRTASAALNMHTNGMPILRHTLQLVDMATSLVDAHDSHALQRLHARLRVVHDLSRTFKHLWSARSDTSAPNFALGIEASFDPKAALVLLSQVHRVVDLLEHAARGAIGAPCHELAVLTLAAPQRLFAEVLAGIHAFIGWLERVSNDQWVEALAISGATTPSPGGVSVYEHARVQLELAKRAAAALKSATVDVDKAAQALAHAKPVEAPFWDALFGTVIDESADDRTTTLGNYLAPAVPSRLKLATQAGCFFVPVVCEV
ncbi:hypothetical protein MCUN1_000409 [Malassezia cuniculi]|uniref:Uncharacterized protein n=1 Tax=Malassezia cuniculi TaxID=948313 RepID=A0AAF0ESA4_9BASI|nr:hypothetical protein MCUN1_000409 [Malassezia cuniculi]